MSRQVHSEKQYIKFPPKETPPPLFTPTPPLFPTKHKIQNNIMHDYLAASIVGGMPISACIPVSCSGTGLCVLGPKDPNGQSMQTSVTGYSHVINPHHRMILCTLSKCPHAIISKLQKQYFAHVEYSYLHLICTKP